MNLTVFSFFLAGLATALIPIVIHLLSKGKPKKIVFPALQFASAKLVVNKRKLTLKRLLLLALRVCVFVILGLILARPYFAPKTPTKTLAESAKPSQESSDAPNAEQSAPSTNAQPETAGIAGRDAAIATAIVVDTSARMGRVKENATLFARAKETGLAILEQSSKGSEIAILDGSYDGDAFQPDRFAAKTRLEKLAIEPTGRSVSQSTLEAIALLERSDLTAKEIFVLTDSTRQGWPERDARKLNKLLAPTETNPNPPTLYFVDLGDDDPRNASIVDLALSAETISQNAPLRIDVEVERVSPIEGNATIELVILDSKKLPNDLSDAGIFNDPSIILRREKQTLSFEEGRSKRAANFQTSDLPPGSCVGAIRLVGTDALSADDARWFVVDVVEDWKLLVVAPEPIEEKALFFSQALAPEELQRSGRAPFELDVISFASNDQKRNRNASNAPNNLLTATEEELARYKAIFLLDPPGLDDTIVKRLTHFVENGGGLGVFLGNNATPIASFQTPEAIKLLGCKPTTRINAPEWDRQLAPIDYNAPILGSFRPFEKLGIPWDALPIARYWKLEEVADSATIPANIIEINSATQESKSNPQDVAPGLVENRLGRGLVATLATPISDSAQGNPWNALATGDAAWVFVVFADGLARRLASGSSSILNYSTGEVATLRSPLKIFPGSATIVTPTGEEIITPTDVERRQIRFPGLKTPGVYRVKTTPNKDGETIDASFAVALPHAQFDLSRYSEEDWEKLWEGVPYKKLDLKATGKALENARHKEDKNPYAFLVMLLTCLFIAETWVGNRFYAGRG